MDKEDLVLLKFKEKDEKKQLKWHHSEEFEHNGEMYDIVKKEVVADTTYYWCWPDNEETKLNTQLDKLLICALENIPQRKDNQKRVSDFFKSLYHQEKSKTGIVFCQLTQQNLHYSCSSYSSLTFPPPVPPPEIV